MSEWGVTPTGFRRPTYAELLDALEYKARELWGGQVNLTVRSFLGLSLRIFAWILNLLFSLAEDVYNSSFVDTAVGHALYNLGKLIGIKLRSAQKATGILQVKGQPGVQVPLGFLAATTSGVRFVSMEAAALNLTGEASVKIAAFSAGSDGNVAANAITQIINPVTGIQSVTNERPTDGGRERETDEQFRVRYMQSTDFAGGVNVDALAAELLENVEGVYSAIVYENYTDEWADGLPPHSIFAIVHGGGDADVAKALFRRRAGGIEPHGDIEVMVTSLSGQLIPIRFSRPQTVSIWVKVSNLVTDAAFGDDGNARIAAALIDYIGGTMQGGLGIGEDVIYNRLPCVLNGVAGVVDYEMVISGDGSAWSRDNIVIDRFGKAVTDGTKVILL